MRHKIVFTAISVCTVLFFMMCGSNPNTTQKISIPLERFAQPNNITCGPTSLRMVMNYYKHPADHEDVMKHFTIFPGIGVLDPHLSMTAMDYGFDVTDISYNYRVIHPSWEKLSSDKLLEKLEDYLPNITNYKDSVSAAGYIRYLKRGGKIEFHPLSKELIISYLEKGVPVISALDMEYLYAGTVDWSAGKPEHSTHFVVIHGYNPGTDEFEISDPWYEVPIPNENGHYFVSSARLITSILLGFQVNDADLVIVQLKNNP